MHLIKNDIVDIANRAVAAFCELYNVQPQELYQVERWSQALTGQGLAAYSHALDFGAAGWIANQTKTFIFNSEQILEFVRAIDRRLPPGDYPAPFDFICIQFTTGIDEKLFTTGLRSSGSIEASDEILALMIAVPTGDNPSHRLMNVIAWYKSTSINRIQLKVDGNGEIEYRTSSTENAEALYQDKQRLANLALLCLSYIDSPGIVTERVAADPNVNRKRLAKGKRPLEDYYVCRVESRRTDTGAPDEPSGRHVGFRFDVRGHFRRMADGRTVWIRPHQRGIEHELYKPKIYEVE